MIKNNMILVSAIVSSCVFQCVYTTNNYSSFYNTTNVSPISKIILSIISSFNDSKSSSPIYFIRKSMSISTYHYQSDILDESLKQISGHRSINIINIDERNQIVWSMKVRRFYNVILIDDYNSFR